MDNDDAALVDTVAREFIDHQGRDALPRLYEAAELSAEMGDQLSWKAWRDIAEAAERIIRSEQKLSEQTATIPCRSAMAGKPSFYRATPAELRAIDEALAELRDAGVASREPSRRLRPWDSRAAMRRRAGCKRSGRRTPDRSA